MRGRFEERAERAFDGERNDFEVRRGRLVPCEADEEGAVAFDGVEEPRRRRKADEDEDEGEDEPTTSTDDSSSFVRVVLEDDPVSGYEAWEKVFTHAACVGLSMDALLDHLVKNAMHRTGARRPTTPTTDAAPSATDPASSPRMRVYVLFGGSPSSGYTGRQLYLTLRNIPTIDATRVGVRARRAAPSTGRRPRVAITLRLGRGPESMVRERRFTSSRSRFGSILHAQTRARGFRKVSLDIAVERHGRFVPNFEARPRASCAWARSSPSPRPRAPSSSTPHEVPVPRSPTVLYNNSASPRASRTPEVGALASRVCAGRRRREQ